jgi:membrane associated rhomboid family serine protease
LLSADDAFVIGEPLTKPIAPASPAESSQKAKGFSRFAPVLALIVICWGLFAIDHFLLSGRLLHHGILPRHREGLIGILWAPFLHTSFSHLTANTLPLLILGGIICARSAGHFVGVSLAGIIIGGALTWVFARTAYHVGASGLIFCYFGYLGSLAWFRRSFGTLLLSLACIAAYGGILKGIVPTAGSVSWEGHLGGLIAGVVVAWLQAPKKTSADESSSS